MDACITEPVPAERNRPPFRLQHLAGWAFLAVVIAGLVPPLLTHVLVEKRWPKTAAQLLRFERIGHLWFLDRALRKVGLR